MAQSFKETAHLKTDLVKYESEHVRIFGDRPKEFCELCDKRISWCECDEELKEKE